MRRLDGWFEYLFEKKPVYFKPYPEKSMTSIASPAGIALTGIAATIKALYGTAKDINTFIDEHIEALKASDNHTISRTGRVIEAAKYGFGIGYSVPILIISAGQLILGNPLSAATAIASAATFTNPLAMTCAAVGAIYYGWGALSEIERTEICEKLHKGLEVGVELTKAVVQFVIAKTKEFLSPENFKEFKRFVGDAAATFGRTLGDITGAIRDRVTDAYETVKEKSEDAVDFVAGKVRKKTKKSVGSGEGKE
ncbi:MAG: hypothetical protein ACT4P9_07265 [Betaproteobacteria bacterium]